MSDGFDHDALLTAVGAEQGAGEGAEDFHCRHRGYFPEKPETEVRAHIRQKHVFIYHSDI